MKSIESEVQEARVEMVAGGSEVQRTMLELLNQLDEFEPTRNIKVIRATNSIGMPFVSLGYAIFCLTNGYMLLDILDPAFLRPGCIDRKL